MNRNNKGIWFLLAAAFIFQLALFVYVNTRPIYWVQNETLLHRFFWSMDGIDQFTLHTGLRKADLIKPFHGIYVDGIFRARQVSYFFEMISFKFWQYWELGFVRNPTLAILHLANTALVGILIFLISRSKISGALASLIFINSGIAINTLLFPFRNAKLLVVTFFLLAAILIFRCKDKFHRSSALNIFMFYGLIFLLFFTDEASVFFILTLAAFLFIKDGKEELGHRSMLLSSSVCMLTIFLSLLGCLKIFYSLVPNATQHIEYGKYIIGLGHYYLQPQTWIDIPRSFAAYFMKFNFGVWSLSPSGILAFIVFAMFSFFWIRSFIQLDRMLKGFVVTIFFVFLLKTIFLPHNSGAHDILMPKDTVFPSLLYFNFYYTYPETAFWAMIIALGFIPYLNKIKKFSFLLTLLCLISFFNVVHIPQALKSVLVFHEWDNPLKQDTIKSVLGAQKIISQRKSEVGYISFPTGDEKILRGRIDDGDNYVLARIVPIMFLRSIEDGRTIISLRNIPNKLVADEKEIFNSDYFLDVGSVTWLNLAQMKKSYPEADWQPQRAKVNAPLRMNITANSSQLGKVIFFIKGKANFIFSVNGNKLTGSQIYGESYQVFSYDLHATNLDAPIQLLVEASGPNKEAFLVGPFITQETINSLE